MGMTDGPVQNSAQLGCGTLIIIALIVSIFSGGSDSKALRSGLEEANRKIDRLEQKIDVLSARLAPQPIASPPREP